MIEVNSYLELSNAIKGKGRTYLLIFKSGTERSDCAFRNLSVASAQVNGVDVFAADVNKTRDIHVQFNLTTVPTLLEIEHGEPKNVIKGCNDSNYYKALFDNALYQIQIKGVENTQKQVTVYSTPTCSWCNTLKAHLRKHRIIFSDIDVSKNEQIAEDLVRRSGQRGVPQTDIGGEIVVGFNQQRINELLGIKA